MGLGLVYALPRLDFNPGISISSTTSYVEAITFEIVRVVQLIIENHSQYNTYQAIMTQASNKAHLRSILHKPQVLIGMSVQLESFGIFSDKKQQM